MHYKTLIKFLYQFISLLILGSCISKFDPPAISSLGYFVVDGHIYIEDKMAKVKLSRSQSLTSTDEPAAEKGALVQIESESGTLYSLIEGTNGVYTIGGTDFEYGVKYHLKVKTTNGNEYESEYLAANQTPEIDDLNFAKGTDFNWQLRVSTHDPNNNTFYYRWEYEETWEYVSGAKSSWVWKNPPVADMADTNIYHCWKFANSSAILTTSTKKLSVDVVNNFVVNDIAINSDPPYRKLDRNYSILVKQYAVNLVEFNYWEELKKNTQNTGSIFDPQPTQVTGNVHRIANTDEVVLGYFSPYSVSSKRITKAYSDFDMSWSQYVESCVLDTVLLADVPSLSPIYALVDAIAPMEVLIGYSYTNKTCADCRSSFNGGGINVEPEYMK